MKDQSQILIQHQVNSHSQFLFPNQSHKMIHHSGMAMNQSHMLQQLQMQPQMAKQQPKQAPRVNKFGQPMMAQPHHSKIIGQSYGQWSQPPPNMAIPPMNAMQFPNPMNQMYGDTAKPVLGSWKGKKSMDKRKDVQWKDNSGCMTGAIHGGGAYQPPTLYELEQQNRMKATKFYPKKRFNRMGPYAHAPRNTTSYLIRAKKSGGIASLVSPCPVTPAVLPTPVFSPSREALVEMAKEEWGVDGYGSMKGLIRLRSPGHDEAVDDYEDEDEEGSSEGSDVEEHVEVEKRLDHDLSRFEMIYPNKGVDCHNNVLGNRVDDQDTQIAQLEEENMMLKEKLYFMEREVGELSRRLLRLERQNQVVEEVNEEFMENVSGNDSQGRRSVVLQSSKQNEEVDFVPRYENEKAHENPRELVMREVLDSEEVGNALKDEQIPEPKRNEDIGSERRGGYEWSMKV